LAIEPETDLVEQAHALSADTVLSRLKVSPDAGLDTAEARRRRRHYGLNRLRRHRPRGPWLILLDQLRSLIVGLLTLAALAALWFGHHTESAAIAGVIVLNTLIGFVTELRAVRSMQALRELGVRLVNVRRGGRVTPIPARGLVPGDIVVLEAGDVASADIRLIKSSRLQCNEAILTGESLPVAKQVDPVAKNAALAERTSMVYLGTSVTRGSGDGVVVGTGGRTELGRIAQLMEEAEPGRTPLERRLDELSRQLMWLALVLAAAIGVAGMVSGRDVFLMIESAIALAVATVPEGLPMVATLALARGMLRMARRQALIERLSAVETLGAATVILTDKTGTLTENRMTVTEFNLAGGRSQVLPPIPASGRRPPAENLIGEDRERLQLLLEVAVLCNNASLAGGDAIGDPMEVALLELADGFGIDTEQQLERCPLVREHAFDPDLRMMATVHRSPDNVYFHAVKGAPEAVLDHVKDVDVGTRNTISSARKAASEMAGRGLRVLALAGKTTSAESPNPFEQLTLYGLVGLTDPPREDVADAISACQAAGVRVIMVTGDHGATALSIAAQIGLTEDHAVQIVEGADFVEGAPVDASVFARVSPAQKLAIIESLQHQGEVVAMLGDGVNDAPALHKADIGIAMGQRGSQVAREAADMVLLDDRFGTIISAIAQGRVIFGNIRKFVIYLMSCNASELLVIGLASLSGAPLPLLPLQILYLNLVTDVFPAFALGAGEGEPDAILRRGPRPPDEPLLATRHWRDIAIGATIITAATLCSFALALTVFELTAGAAVTLSFLTLALAQLWHVFNMRAPGSSRFNNEITRNRYVWMAIVLCLVLIIGPVYVPAAAALLGLGPPPAAALVTALGLSLIPLVIGQVSKTARTRSSR
jgi:Ca2+-transporting ATPase